MTPLVKAEFRKLFSVRSTYVILLLVFILLLIFAFYVEGIRAGNSVVMSGKLAGEVRNAITTTGVFVAIAAALLMTHEYRYNTIMYTLTASRSRLQVLLAKIIVVSVFAVLFGLVVGASSPVLTYLGISIKGLDLAPQVFPFWDLLWRSLFMVWGYGMLGLLLATLIRSQVGTIVAIFFIPSTVEPLLGLILKEDVAYLPFTLLTAVMQNIPNITHGRAALILSCYIAAAWVVTATVFRRRDAN